MTVDAVWSWMVTDPRWTFIAAVVAAVVLLRYGHQLLDVDYQRILVVSAVLVFGGAGFFIWQSSGFSDPVRVLAERLVTVAVLAVGTVWMNRGNSWVLDVLNLDAPVLLGVGVVILLAAPAPWNLAGLIPAGIAAIRCAPDLVDAM